MIRDWNIFGEGLTLSIVLFRIVAAVFLSALIGLDRELKNRPAGLRTHILVCLGALLIAMTEQQLVSEVSAFANSQINVSVGRLSAAVVSGVGFLGAGTILMANKKVSGLTTAASLWCTACLGVAIGFGFTILATLGTAFVLIVLILVNKFIRVNDEKRLEVKFIHREETLTYLNSYFAERKIKILAVDFHSEKKELGNLYTNVYRLSIPSRINTGEIAEALSEYKNIQVVRTMDV